MNQFTKIFGLTWGMEYNLYDDEVLREEINAKAEQIYNKAREEFDDFLSQKGLENIMGMICPKDNVKVIYHITDIDWFLDDESGVNPKSLPETIDAENITDEISDYLFREYGYCVKSYNLSVEIIDEPLAESEEE